MPLSVFKMVMSSIQVIIHKKSKNVNRKGRESVKLGNIAKIERKELVKIPGGILKG